MKEHLYYGLNGPYDVAGALNAGGTICEGYAVVYREIADRLGFYCERVVSWEMNHAWNFIVVDGMGYGILYGCNTISNAASQTRFLW